MENRYSTMNLSGTTRKLLTAMLALAISLWAEAGLALVTGDQVMQCAMAVHEMEGTGDMTCCPGDEAQAPVTAMKRPPCCSASNLPERPLGFVVSSERTTVHPSDAVTGLPESFVPRLAHSGIWRSADAPRFKKPVLELKTDLRI